MTGERSGRGVRPGPTVKGTGTMTAREMLRRRLRRIRVGFCCYVAAYLGVTVVATLLASDPPALWGPWVLLVTFLFFAILGVVLVRGERLRLRCPWCRGDLITMRA